MACCPNGIYSPLIIDCCSGLPRPLRSNESLKIGTATVSNLGVLTLNNDLSLETSGAHLPILVARDSIGAEYFSVRAFLNSSNNMAIGTGSSITTGENNTLIGKSAATVLADGERNVFVGALAGAANISGDNNMGVGWASLLGCTGSGNLGIGTASGALITSGSDNVFLGLSAGSTGQLATASNSIAIGANVVTTASNQIVIGNATNDSLQVGVGSTFSSILHAFATGNVLLGTEAGESITSGVDNTLIGVSCGKNIADGSNNAGLGDQALFNLISGGQNLGIGTSALASIVGVNGNTAIGYASLLLTTSSSNTAFGRDAGRSLTSGGSNTFIGHRAGHTGQLATASNSIAVGNGVVTTASNQIVIGNVSNDHTVLRGQVDITNDDATAVRRVYVMQRETTSASALNLLTASGAASVAMPENSVATYRVTLSAIRDDGTEGAAYIITGAARRDGAAAPVALGTLNNLTVIGEDDASWLALVAVTGNNLRIGVVGAASKTIQWSGTWELNIATS